MSSKKKPVWKFTNGVELNEKEFCNYLERKIFKTIRRFCMLGSMHNKLLKISSLPDLNTQVLNKILELRFQVVESKKPFFSSENLSDASEKIFLKLLKGKFEGIKPLDDKKRPLYFISDREIELYANIKKINGLKSKRNKKIQELFSKFMKNNPDLEHNIVNAFKQLK
jgi:hypothetical protein